MDPQRDERAVEGRLTAGSRPRALRVLMVLEVVIGLFGLLWPTFLPLIPLRAMQPVATNRPVVIIMVISTLSIMNLVVTGGLWMRQQWAFRLGLITTVFTLAIDLFIILVSISQTVLDVGAVLALVLTSVVLSCFLQAAVIRTVVEWKRRG